MAKGQKSVNFHLDFDKLAANGRRGALRAAAFISLGEGAWKTDDIRTLNFERPHSYVFFPDPVPKELAETLRLEFRRWVISNALLEIDKGLSLFLDEVYSGALLMTFSGRRIDKAGAERFRRIAEDTNVSSKLEKICEEFGITSWAAEDVFGWTQARNCIAHNHGWVRPRDCTEKGALVVSWRELEIRGNGSPLKIGERVEKDTQVEVAWVRRQKTFNVGASVDLAEEELIPLCFTAYMIADHLIHGLHALREKIGLETSKLPSASG